MLFGQSTFWSPELPQYANKESFEKVGLPWGEDTFLFLIAKRPGPGQEWLWYSLARDPLLFEVARVWPSHTTLAVSVVDAEGKPIAGETFSSSLNRGLTSGDGTWAMQATPFGAINIGGNLWSFCSAGSGDMYSDWIVSNRVRTATGNGSNTPIYIGEDRPTHSNASGVAAVVCPAGFFASGSTIMTDSYAQPFVLDVPLSALELADNVEVRLGEERVWNTETISIETKWRDRTTSKTVEWKQPKSKSK